MPSLWIDALKKFNFNKESWCVPRKGTADNDKVRRIMKGEAAAASSPVKKPAEKKEMATSPMKAETPKPVKAETPKPAKVEEPKAKPEKKAKKVVVKEPKAKAEKKAKKVVVEEPKSSSKPDYPKFIEDALKNQHATKEGKGRVPANIDTVIFGDYWAGSEFGRENVYKTFDKFYSFKLENGQIKGLEDVIKSLKTYSTDERNINRERFGVFSGWNYVMENLGAPHASDIAIGLQLIELADSKDRKFTERWYDWKDGKTVKYDDEGRMRDKFHNGLPEGFDNGCITLGIGKEKGEDIGSWFFVSACKTCDDKTYNDEIGDAIRKFWSETDKGRAKRYDTPEAKAAREAAVKAEKQTAKAAVKADKQTAKADKKKPSEPKKYFYGTHGFLTDEEAIKKGLDPNNRKKPARK